MSFMDQLRGIARQLHDDAEKTFSRIRDQPTMRRVCQAAFLIGRADGDFDASEKAMLQRIIASKLPSFSGKDILREIDAAEAELEFSVEGGIATLIADIGRAKGSDQAPLIMVVVLAVANADGTFDDDEKAVARRIATALGLALSEYGL